MLVFFFLVGPFVRVRIMGPMGLNNLQVQLGEKWQGKEVVHRYPGPNEVIRLEKMDDRQGCINEAPGVRVRLTRYTKRGA